MMLASLSIRATLLGLALATLTPVALFAQTPAPKKQAELVAAGNKPLTGPQITALLLGNTTYNVLLASVGPNTKAGDRFMTYYRDARTRVTFLPSGPLAGKYEEKWWIEGNQACSDRSITKQGAVCASLYQISSDVYRCNSNGDCNLMMRVVAGNPEKL